MEVKLINQDKEKLTFVIKGIDYVLINTLRRMVLEEVPTLAIEDINFVQNSSALADEMLALRIGLVPLTTDLKSYILPEQAKNETDPRAFVNFKMKVDGPKDVIAEDLRSQDPKVQPVYPDILLVKLLEKQIVELEAIAILGNGKRHMKFAPGLVYYHNTQKVIVKKKDAGDFKDKYPSTIFDNDGKINASLIKGVTLIDACKGINPDIIDVSEEEDSFEFTLESWGQLKIKETLNQAINLFNDKLDEFEKLLKKLK